MARRSTRGLVGRRLGRHWAIVGLIDGATQVEWIVLEQGTVLEDLG
jgi:hypothetical protein